MDKLIEVRYWNDLQDEYLEKLVEFNFYFLGLKNTSLGYDNVGKFRYMGFEKNYSVSPIWIHVCKKHNFLALIDGFNVKAEYNVKPIGGYTIDGVFYIKDMIEDPKNYFKESEPKSLKPGSLTGRVMSLNAETFDYINNMYRPIGIHGADSFDTAISGGCVIMSNEDVKELYDKVMIATPVVISNSLPMKDIIPTELRIWVEQNGFQQKLKDYATR